MKNINPDSMQHRTSPGSTLLSSCDLCFTLFVFFFALSIRFLPWNHVFDGGKVYFFDPDCYIRLRKILIYINSFPKTHVYDYFQGFPKGTGVISSPAMEYLIAVFTYPFHSFSGFGSMLEKGVALAPPLMGAVTAVAVYLFVRHWWGRAAGLCAALVLALHPKHIQATVLGRFDNEMVEPLFLLVTFWLYIVAGRKRAIRYWVGLGILSVMYLLVWRGALFPLSLIGVDLLLQVFRRPTATERIGEIAKGAGLMYLTAAAVTGLICITDVLGTSAMFSWNIVSWFHAALFAGAGFLFLLIYLYGKGSRGSSPDRRRGVAFACIGIISVVLLVVFRTNIMEGLKVVAGGNAWIDSISQYQRAGNYSRTLGTFGFLSLLAPLALFLLPTAPFKDLTWKRFLILWTVVMVAATVSRDRYAEYLALNVAILAGMLVYYCRSMGYVKSALASCSAIVVLLALQIPTYAFFSNLYQTGGTFNIKGDVEQTMLWLRDHTPLPGDPYRPSVKPAYGVMARWDYGGWIESIALRPSIATNYGTETYGMEEAARFLLSRDEDELRSVLERNGIRYVIVDKVLGDLPMYARLIGRDARFFEEKWNSRLGTTEYIPSPEVFSLVSSRLFFADGSLVQSSGISFKPVEDLRLVYESATPASVGGFPWEIKRMKIFEAAKGATVHVRGIPGTEISLSQPIETNQGRLFTYNNRKTFDKSGMATFRLLYPRKQSILTTGAVGQPIISANGRRQAVQVGDEDIATGRILQTLVLQ